MTLFTIAARYLQGRLVASVLTAVSIALGVSLVVASVLLARGVRDGFVEGTTDYNLIVGAKGSPTQLVLNVVFRIDTPTPNISLRTYEYLKDDPRVEVAVPVAMGDAYQGFRYVATTGAYFAQARCAFCSVWAEASSFTPLTVTEPLPLLSLCISPRLGGSG